MEIPGFFGVSDVLRGGVYVLVWKGEVVYIGKSKCMVARIYAHRSLHRRHPGSDVPKWLKVKGIKFDEIHVKPCLLSDVDRVEQEMIRLYKPKFNTYHVGARPTGPIPLKIGNIEIMLGGPVTPAKAQIERRI